MIYFIITFWYTFVLLYYKILSILISVNTLPDAQGIFQSNLAQSC
jgi:hypothetical protein